MNKIILAFLLIFSSAGVVFAQDAGADPGVLGDLGIVIGIVLGLVGAGSVGFIAARLMENKEAIAALERLADRLADSFPPETEKLIVSVANNLEQVSRLIHEMFDDVPANEKDDTPIE